MATWTTEQSRAFYLKRQRTYGKFLLSSLQGALKSAVEIRDTAERRQVDRNKVDRTEYEEAKQLRLKAQSLIDDIIELLENNNAGASALFSLIEEQTGVSPAEVST